MRVASATTRTARLTTRTGDVDICAPVGCADCIKANGLPRSKCRLRDTPCMCLPCLSRRYIHICQGLGLEFGTVLTAPYRRKAWDCCLPRALPGQPARVRACCRVELQPQSLLVAARVLACLQVPRVRRVRR